jgi:hypothetical protein
MMEINKPITFHEQQRFRTGFLIILLMLCMLLPIGILFYSMSTRQIAKVEFVLSTLAVLTIDIPIVVFFYYTKLETIVTGEGLGYRWWPLQNKYRMLFKDDIMEVKARKGPLFNYGIHWLPSYGWVHNVRGRSGFQIRMRSGKRLFIGSQKINELKSALQAILKKIIPDFRNEF